MAGESPILVPPGSRLLITHPDLSEVDAFDLAVDTAAYVPLVALFEAGGTSAIATLPTDLPRGLRRFYVRARNAYGVSESLPLEVRVVGPPRAPSALAIDVPTPTPTPHTITVTAPSPIPWVVPHVEVR